MGAFLNIRWNLALVSNFPNSVFSARYSRDALIVLVLHLCFPLRLRDISRTVTSRLGCRRQALIISFLSSFLTREEDALGDFAIVFSAAYRINRYRYAVHILSKEFTNLPYITRPYDG